MRLQLREDRLYGTIWIFFHSAIVIVTSKEMGSAPILAICNCDVVTGINSIHLFCNFCHLLTIKYRLVLVKMPRRVISHRKQRIILILLWFQLQLNIREVWIHPLNEDRMEKGEFYTLYPDLCHYPSKFPILLYDCC